MNKKYTVSGDYTISFTMEIIAESEEEAIELAYSNAEYSIATEWNGNSVFVDSSYDDCITEFTLCAEGSPVNIEVTDECDYEEDDDNDDA